jgi:hypothetical protein
MTVVAKKFFGRPAGRFAFQKVFAGRLPEMRTAARIEAPVFGAQPHCEKWCF